MRANANPLALRVVRQILDAARPVELDVAGVRVACAMSRGPGPAWPAKGVERLDESADGPWPRPVNVECSWPGGNCTIVARAQYVRSRGRYRHDVVLELTLRDNGQRLLWINVATPLGQTEEGKSFRLRGYISLTKVFDEGSPSPNRLVNHTLKELIAAAKLPLASSTTVDIGEVELPDLTILPSAEAALERAVHLALFKLDFIDRGAKAASRGKALIDVDERLRAAETTPLPPEVDEEAEDEEGEEDEEEETAPLRRYWAGGFRWDQGSQLDAFLKGKYWQVGWPRGSSDPTAKSIWKLFDQIRTGDWLAIKGYGGKHDLIVHFVGEVVGVDPQAGRVDLREIDVPHYKGKAPSGQGAGSWFDTLVPVTRADVIEDLFRGYRRLPLNLPLSLILYGPPGTGKTLRVQEKYSESFEQAGRPDPVFVTFHQAYGYEDFIEGIRPRVVTGGEPQSGGLVYELKDGVLKEAAREALRRAGYEGSIDDFCKLDQEERRRRMESAPPYAIFIDEINRGNVARIFGELITLLEPDKRLGAPYEIIVTLPYSRTKFGMPKNLHVIGTMNTADRSVEALDTALRRRFDFEELPPRPDLLDFTIEGQIDPAAMLRAINERLEKVYDRDHTIGHSYFMGLKESRSLDGLKKVFKRSILPLLQEYFFGDLGKIGLVLGRAFVRRRDAASVLLAEFDHDDRDTFGDKPVWQIEDVENLTNESFQSIYRDGKDNA